MRETKKLRKEIDKWIKNNGACNIKVKEEEILLYNGGLFGEMDKNKVTLWIGDLDDTIRYLRRLKSFLNKNKFNTRKDINSNYLDKLLKRKYPKGHKYPEGHKYLEGHK